MTSNGVETREHNVENGGHSIRVVEIGDPAGIPVIFFHGGPGAGLDVNKAVLFDTSRYRVIVFDQRGVGGSTPAVAVANDVGELSDNTTTSTLDDVERIRDALGITSRCVLAGGSFGSTLSLAYAMKHPDHAAALFIYGIWLCRDQDVKFFDPDGAAATARAENYRYLLDLLDPTERADPVAAYEKRFWHSDSEVRHAAARRWMFWNKSLNYTHRVPAEASTPAELDSDLTASRLFTFYKRNHMFLEALFGPSDGNNQLVENLRLLPDVPIEILNGDRDLITPFEEAETLHSGLVKLGANARLTIVPGIGHSTSEPGYVPALLETSTRLANAVGSQVNDDDQ